MARQPSLPVRIVDLIMERGLVEEGGRVFYADDRSSPITAIADLLQADPKYVSNTVGQLAKVGRLEKIPQEPGSRLLKGLRLLPENPGNSGSASAASTANGDPTAPGATTMPSEVKELLFDGNALSKLLNEGARAKGALPALEEVLEANKREIAALKEVRERNDVWAEEARRRIGELESMVRQLRNELSDARAEADAARAELSGKSQLEVVREILAEMREEDAPPSEAESA